MRKAGIVVIIVALSYFSCKRNGNQESGKAAKTDTTQFFQVSQYLEGQIKEVNSTPFFIYKIEINNGKRDSTPINTAIFNQISAQFLKPDINNEQLKPQYTENIFEDQTTKGFTISYSTMNKKLEIQNVDILLKDDGHTVNRVFIRKFYNYPDSSAIEQLSWKPGESFQVIRSVQKTDNKEVAQQTTVVWNKKS